MKENNIVHAMLGPFFYLVCHVTSFILLEYTFKKI